MDFPAFEDVLSAQGYSPCVATILAILCTECPRRVMEYDGVRYFAATGTRGLPQGACTSPGLSNQVARRLDRRLGGLASKLGVSYTRYADDLTFSGNEELEGRVGYLFARVRHIAQDEGFTVNEAKSRVLRGNTRRSSPGWWSTTGLGWRGRRCAATGDPASRANRRLGEPEPRRAA